jgi:hypothetical protein
MDFLFKKKMLMRNKPTVSMFKKSFPIGLPVAPSMMRQQLVGVGGAGIRKLVAPAVAVNRPLIGAGGVRKIIFK